MSRTALDLSLYFIADPAHTAGRPVDEVVRRAVDAGVSLVQLRAKNMGDRELLTMATAVREITRAASVPLIINDRADIALAVDADGVHVGPGDLPVHVVRRLLGPERWVGASAATPEIAARQVRDGADYLGMGAIYDAHGAKPDASKPRGPGWIAAMVQESSVPIVGIGGITAATAAEVIAAGAAGVAVIRAIGAAPEIEAATAALLSSIEEGRGTTQ